VEIPIRQRLGWDGDAEVYRQIRRLWIEHSKAEDARDIPGLIATLSEDCVYELVPSGHRWEGHEGAGRFYTEFLGAFPDVAFALTDIVIGPQGVIEVADLTGTFVKDWLGVPATGARVEEQVVIHFPWQPEARRFAGERIFLVGRALLGAGDAVSGPD